MRLEIIAIALTLTAPAFAATDTGAVEQSFDAALIKKVEAKNLSGTISVTGGEGKQATVRVSKKDFGEHCKVEIEREGSELEVTVERKGMGGKACDADIFIAVARPVSLDLSAGSGAIDVKGTKGPVTFAVGSGEVKVEGEVESIDGRTGSGGIKIDGMLGGGKIKTGSGSVAVKYKTAPARGSLDIRTGSGAAEVALPAGSKLRTTLASGSGSLTNELGDTADAKFVVQMKSGSGGLTIKKD